MTSPERDHGGVAILGAGNIGQALATGWISAEKAADLHEEG